MEWFRFYDSVLDDPKVQRLPAELFKTWVNLLCLANRGAPRGTLPDALEDIAFALRLSEEAAAKALTELQARGLFDDWPVGAMPHNWNGRQFHSDDSNARVALHRQRKATALYNKEETLQETQDVTLHETLHVTPPEQNRYRTDTEQSITPLTPQGEPAEPAVREVPKQQSARAPRKRPAEADEPPEFVEFWQLYPKRDGVKGSKAAALAEFVAKPPGDWPLVLAATQVYATICGPNGERRRPKDAERFLKDDTFWRGMLAISPEEIGAAERSNGNGNGRHENAADRQARIVGQYIELIAAGRTDAQPVQDPPAGRAQLAGPDQRDGPRIVDITARSVG